MNIDRILSRFKIQTKVLIFILPFVVSITAVGLTGLYASGLLQERMEISNSVLQSLSGFRDVSDKMNKFLDETTPELRDTVKNQLIAQRDLLNQMLSQLDENAEGWSDLSEATKSINGVIDRFDGLWALHEKEEALKKAIRDGENVIVGSQMKLNESATELQRAVRTDESAAKSMLREAERITTSAAFLSDLASKYTRQKSPEEKLKFVQGNLDELKKRARILRAALPAKNKAVSQSLQTAVGDLAALSSATSATDDLAAKMNTKLSSFRQISVYLGLAASQKMKEATLKFAELDQPLVKAEGVLGDSRKVVSAGYSIQIELARFMIAPTAENLARLKKEFDIVKTDMVALSGSAHDLDFFKKLESALLPAVAKMDTDSKALVSVTDERMGQFTAAAADIDAIWKQLTAFAELQKESAGKERDSANSISVGATITGILIAIFAGIGLVMTFKGPIGQITSAMRKLAEGVLDTRINGEARIDEIGEMARALGVFKQNALSKIEIEQRSDAERAAAEEERRRNDAEKLDVDRQIDFAVNALAAGLGRLSQGDISQTIETPFFGKLETLRADFNSSLSKLQDTMARIRENTEMIQHNAGEMSAAADDLAKRTEQQAAALEQTAAAVEEITVTVKSSAERAEEANRIVGETKKSADASSTVVSSAIDAMGRIEDASNQIVQIIDVIDDIAFQTNLLALNAGIEAARAGEAGKGFAVVAQEVRELAQRSAGAAQQIKDLIGKSSTEVSSGSRLVQQTGEVLAEISHKIVTVSERVEAIAMASRDQSNALAEVNSSVNSMDQMTQRNAAMVEETNAATRQLADEADNLMGLVQQFRLAGQSHQARRAA
ncbi:methyl-accepting chemotaxis protein [Rhizobium sp. TRM95796]|uniref:methyl-accepting chemotaxis protein n=1 Tax=Rhizobium sp. TRM95796 TaxID=2979862 RepID=UPI0021E7A581|nr:HAMP domain-containing methyl-accepting chemotaxis protein [Rhizobium sp. TRM95796]MCV3766280.1 methyl-accepting chemotaxis protein [Rhizobium sp. TRM95796]